MKLLVMGVERRGRIVRGSLFGQPDVSGRSCVSELRSQDKPFDISKWDGVGGVSEGEGQQGAAGVDGQLDRGVREGSEGEPLQDLEPDVLGKLLSAPGRAVEIPKAHGEGSGFSGCPRSRTGSRRRWWPMDLEKRVEPMFHPDSYGYRPGAVGSGRGGGMPASGAGSSDWVIDLDIRSSSTACRGTSSSRRWRPTH